jgi:hypothetical protein
MASINAEVGGVSVSITKRPDGSIQFDADNWPGASIGPNNETVAGHAGGNLDTETISDAIRSGQDRIEGKQYFIKESLNQINDTRRNPPYDPAYIENLKSQVATAESDINVIRQSQSAWTSLRRQVSTLTAQVNAADANKVPEGEAKTNEEKNAEEAQGTSNEPGEVPANTTESVTTKDQFDFEGEGGSENLLGGSPPEDPPLLSSDEVDAEIANAAERFDQSDDAVNRLSGPPETRRVTPASAQWSGVKDTRVILRTPKSYFGKLTSGPGSEIQKNGGILFPYTPSISYDNQASYGNSNPLHSNYTQYFFKNSSISSITVSGKFTVQNEYDAKMWLSIVHLSRLLTKMPFGSDAQAGSAPPVCRLDGFGNYVLANVPVAVTSFKFDLPDSVDYINVSDGDFINSMAPTVSTLSFTLIPMYSRNEIRNFSVEKFRDGQLTGKGYL